MQLLCCLWMVEIAVALPVAMLDPNPVAIAIAGVFVASFFVFVGGATAVVAAVEDGCEAVEKAAEGGSWFSGLALNLVFNAALVMISLSFWWNVGLNVMVYGFFFANCVSMANVLWNVVYMVYYLRCAEYHHGETVQQFGDSHYAALPGWDRILQFLDISIVFQIIVYFHFIFFVIKLKKKMFLSMFHFLILYIIFQNGKR